jgi:hypothetical protein
MRTQWWFWIKRRANLFLHIIHKESFLLSATQLWGRFWTLTSAPLKINSFQRQIWVSWRVSFINLKFLTIAKRYSFLFRHIFSPSASSNGSWTQTLDLWMMMWVFFYCATAVGYLATIKKWHEYRGCIFNRVSPFHEQAVSHLDRSMHISLWV